SRDANMANRSLPKVEETGITVVPYDPRWAVLYVSESDRIQSIFGRRCAAIEHIGSTAVPGLLAKPIIDILIGSIDGAGPSNHELQALTAEGYVFLGEDGRRRGRWFWRKRGPLAFNISLVPLSSDLWHDNLLIRDYLRSHPLESTRYGEIKSRAAAASP